MPKRGGSSGKSRPKRASIFRSPLPETPPSAASSPLKPRDLHFSSRKGKSAAKLASPSPIRVPAVAIPSPQASIGSIKDLKEMFSSKTDAVKRILDHSHSEIVKEIETSRSRLSKRLKIQMQTCQQLSEEAEKDYRKTSDRIAENMKLMKASYSEILAESQTSASRLCKVTIPELAQSLDKALEGLRSRYKLPPA